MTLIQAILVTGALVFCAYVLRENVPGQRLALRRLAGLGLAGAAVVAVALPDVLTVVAHQVGVTRGTDLMLYVFVMVVLFTAASLYQRLASLEDQITCLTRELALREHGEVPGPTSAP